MSRVRPKVRELTQAGIRPKSRNRHVFVYDGTLVDDDIDAGNIDSVRVVVRQRLGLRRRLGVRLGSIILVVMMVMPTGAVMMVTVIVRVSTGSRIRVDVRTKIVSCGLVTAVGMAEAD